MKGVGVAWGWDVPVCLRAVYSFADYQEETLNQLQGSPCTRDFYRI
jgi:hypothetical protein